MKNKYSYILILFFLISVVFFKLHMKNSDGAANNDISKRTTAASKPSNRNNLILVEDQRGRPGVRSLDFTPSANGGDVDENGIRDDVQTYIEKTYKQDKEKTAIIQYTRAAQAYMFMSSDFLEAKRNWSVYAQAGACLAKVFGTQGWTKEAAEIKSQLLNTSVRVEKYIETQRIMAGHLYENYSGDSPCE